AGVTVAVATNNILNAFTPMGTGDLALMGYLMTAAAHMGTEGDVTDILAMLTAHPARILRPPDYGLHVGARADLVLWVTERPAQGAPQPLRSAQRGHLSHEGSLPVARRRGRGEDAPGSGARLLARPPRHRAHGAARGAAVRAGHAGEPRQTRAADRGRSPCACP